MDERLRKPNVEFSDIKDVESKSVGVRTCIDVIEHVEENLDFALELVRVARQDVLVSTPNWTVSRCKWPYHICEYMPRQLSRAPSFMLICGCSALTVGRPPSVRGLVPI